MKIISSYSIKGGVGKTALAVNLAFALCESGHRKPLLAYSRACEAALAYRALCNKILALPSR